MRESDSNPPENALSRGINESNLVSAIELSGYPLQGVVAGKLQDQFVVTEEWGYVDRETSEHRSLDVVAFKRLSVDGPAKPNVLLLIECKRSVHPYVFFQNAIDRPIPAFPRVAGLTWEGRTVTQKGGGRQRESSAVELLGLAELTFVRPGPPHCSAFTKAIVQGDKVTTSGSDPFNTLILPLVNATDHAALLHRPVQGAPAIFPTLILCVSIVDAPMLLVQSPANASDPVLTPWVRVPRQEAHVKGEDVNHAHYVVDVVHAAFLDTFLSDHLVPFLDTFTSRVEAQSEVLLRGGIAENLETWRWDELQPRGA